MNASTGWAAGVAGIKFEWTNGIYVTHDGGYTWRPQRLPPSPDGRPALIWITPPKFFTANDGILSVNFADVNNTDDRGIDFYVTHDGGGTTWTPVTYTIS